jgi:hypothetical protein
MSFGIGVRISYFKSTSTRVFQLETNLILLGLKKGHAIH